VPSTRFWVVGHGSLEALLKPHKGLIGKALLLPRSVLDPNLRRARNHLDREVARRIEAWQSEPPHLQPIPLLGIPGFCADQNAAFYDDARIFRPPGTRRQPKSQGTNSAPSTSQA
jgi:hypothetical protein